MGVKRLSINSWNVRNLFDRIAACGWLFLVAGDGRRALRALRFFTMRSKMTWLVLLGTMSFVSGMPADAADRLVLRAENEQKIVDCKGLDVLIEGNRNVYTLNGGCNSIVLRGEGDKVRAAVAPGAHITVEGNNVTLTWRVLGRVLGPVAGGGDDPVVSVNGQDSTVTREAAAAPAVGVPMPSGGVAAAPALPAKQVAAAGVAAPIEITIDREARDLDCTGREVHISADGGLYALRGGCSAVIVHGNDDLVQAELAPGARIDLVGKNLKLAFVQMADGAAPAVHVQGEQSKAWAIAGWGQLTGALPKD